MTLTKRARITLAAGIGVVLMTAASGITYAATTAAPTNDYATACSNAKHALRLLNVNGSCPRGTARIGLASAPRSIVIRNVSDKYVQKAISVRGMAVQGGCGRDSDSTLALKSTAAGTIYDVRGADYLGQGQSRGFVYGFNSQSVAQTQNGPGYISYTADQQHPSSGVTLNEGELNTTLIVAHSGHTFTVTLYMQQDNNSCFVEAQISQSS